MDKSKIKVLVVDDEKDITYFTARILEYDGFTVFQALDGAGALEIFHKERPQICLLDVHLGLSEIDGLDVLKEIRETDKSAECIMITRITDHETQEKAEKMGVKHYLLKPLAMEAWLEKVHEVAGSMKEGSSNG